MCCRRTSPAALLFARLYAEADGVVGAERVTLRPEAASALEHPRSGVSPLPPAGSLPSAYLHAGHMFVSRTPCRVSTILGSCVAVALFDPARRSAASTTSCCRSGPENTAPSPRFGNIAVPCADRERWSPPATRRSAAGEALRRRLRAARVPSDRRAPRAEERARWPRRSCCDEGIPIVAEDVDGERGRKLIFQTHDGAAWVRSL